MYLFYLLGAAYQYYSLSTTGLANASLRELIGYAAFMKFCRVAYNNSWDFKSQIHDITMRDALVKGS